MLNLHHVIHCPFVATEGAWERILWKAGTHKRSDSQQKKSSFPVSSLFCYCLTLEKLWQFFNIASRTAATSSHHTWHGMRQCHICTCRIPYNICLYTARWQFRNKFIMLTPRNPSLHAVISASCSQLRELIFYYFVLYFVSRWRAASVFIFFLSAFIFVRKTHCKLSDLCIMALRTVHISNCMYWLVWASLAFI